MAITPQLIYKGAKFLNSTHYTSTLEKFEFFVRKDDTSEDNRSLRDTIRYHEGYFEWTPIPERYFERLQKSAELTQEFRILGNEAYKSKQVSMALRYYNLSLLFAPLRTNLEGLVFANRSALFLFLGEYETALTDCQTALLYKSVLSDDVVQKLVLRETKLEELITSSEDYFKDKKYQGKQFFEDMQLKQENSNIPRAADFIEILYDPCKGRRLASTSEISTGELLLVDHGYCRILDKLLNWDTEHCANCTSPMLGGLTGSDVFRMYCSRDCLKATTTTNKDQDFTPEFLNYVHATEELHEVLIIAQVLLTTGAKGLYEIYENDALLESGNAAPIPGLDEDGHYESNAYQSLYHLIGHEEAPGHQHKLIFKSIFLTHLLSNLTTFFKDFDEPEFRTFVSSLTYKHLTNLKYNMISLSEWKSLEGPLSLFLWDSRAKSNCHKITNDSYGTGVFPLVALCNHSCAPNASFLHNSKLGKALLISTGPIRKGEEICISYKAPFTRLGFKERQDYLLENYKFLCACAPCAKSIGVENMVKCAEEDFSTLLSLEQIKELIKEERYTNAFHELRNIADSLKLKPFDHEVVQLCQDLLRRVVVHLCHL